MVIKKKFIISFLVIIVLIFVFTIGINLFMIMKVSDKILDYQDIIELEDIDAIMVLGCKVNGNEPSMMLRLRLDKGIEVYNGMKDVKLLLTGDHGQVEYDEVNVMRDYTLNYVNDKSDIFLDHAGFSTYDSMYRAKEVFGIDKMIVVTQEYHLYRALYIADELGIEVYGVRADDLPYQVINTKNEIREMLARVKNFVKVIVKPSSKYVGEPIDISGDGNITWD